MTRAGWSDHGGETPWPAIVSSWVKGEGGPVVTLSGLPGIGKSHVGVATLMHYLGPGAWNRHKWWDDNGTGGEVRHGGMYCTGRELAEEYQVGKFRGRPLLTRALKEPLVVVDDVAWDRSLEDIERGAVASLISSAEQTQAGLILTTNLDPELFARIDGRVMSRLAAGVMVPLQGRDRR